MNEPLIILLDGVGGRPVRRFVDGDATHGGGAARQQGRVDSVAVQNPAQRALLRAAKFGHAAAALTEAGLKIAGRR